MPGMTSETRAAIAAERQTQMRRDFDCRFRVGAFCAYRSDELNWVVEKETGTRAAGQTYGWYPSFPDCIHRLLELVTSERDRSTLAAVQASYAEARAMIAAAIQNAVLRDCGGILTRSGGEDV